MLTWRPAIAPISASERPSLDEREIASPASVKWKRSSRGIGQADLVVGAGHPGDHGVAARMRPDLVTYIVTRSPIISLAAQLPIAGLPTCSRIWSLTTACGDG